MDSKLQIPSGATAVLLSCEMTGTVLFLGADGKPLGLPFFKTASETVTIPIYSKQADEVPPLLPCPKCGCKWPPFGTCSCAKHGCQNVPLGIKSGIDQGATHDPLCNITDTNDPFCSCGAQSPKERPVMDASFECLCGTIHYCDRHRVPSKQELP